MRRVTLETKAKRVSPVCLVPAVSRALVELLVFLVPRETLESPVLLVPKVTLVPRVLRVLVVSPAQWASWECRERRATPVVLDPPAPVVTAEFRDPSVLSAPLDPLARTVSPALLDPPDLLVVKETRVKPALLAHLALTANKANMAPLALVVFKARSALLEKRERSALPDLLDPPVPSVSSVFKANLAPLAFLVLL